MFDSKQKLEPIPTGNPFDPEKDSRAVVVNGKHGGIVLWYVGYHLYEEMEKFNCYDLDDLGLEDAQEGISIWEGAFVVSIDANEDGDDSEPDGDFREPTEEEWEAIKQGKPPWDEQQWITEQQDEVPKNID